MKTDNRSFDSRRISPDSERDGSTKNRRARQRQGKPHQRNRKDNIAPRGVSAPTQDRSLSAEPESPIASATNIVITISIPSQLGEEFVSKLRDGLRGPELPAQDRKGRDFLSSFGSSLAPKTQVLTASCAFVLSCLAIICEWYDIRIGVTVAELVDALVFLSIYRETEVSLVKVVLDFTMLNCFLAIALCALTLPS